MEQQSPENPIKAVYQTLLGRAYAREEHFKLDVQRATDMVDRMKKRREKGQRIDPNDQAKAYRKLQQAENKLKSCREHQTQLKLELERLGCAAE